MVTQGAGAGKPAALSDLIDGHRALRQVLAGAQQPLVQQPAGGCFTGGLLKAAQKGARPHAGALGEGSDGMAGGKMLVQIVKQLPKALALPAAGYRAQDLLRLTAVAMGETTRRRATTLAASLPKSSRTRCRQRSIPAALPAEVISKASPT